MLFEKISHIVVNHSKKILFLFITTILLLGIIGTRVFKSLDSGGYLNPDSESFKAAEYIEKKFKIQKPEAVFVIESVDGDLDDDTVTEEVSVLEKKLLNIKGVDHTLSYWNIGNFSGFASKDGKAAYLFVYFKNKVTTDEIDSISKNIQKHLNMTHFQSIKIYASGVGIINATLNQKVAKDLLLAEIISIPLTFLFLIFVFGTLVSSILPVFIGVLAILGSFFFLWVFTLFTPVSVFALNLVTGLGLGLGVDYSLLIVNRFREELHHTGNVSHSILKTIQTAGKTVFYSGLTVMVTLGSLIFFQQPFLKSFAYAGVLVTFLALLSAMLPLPALMHILGKRLNLGVIRKSAITEKSNGGWARTAHFVMRHPISVALVCICILSLFTFPIRHFSAAQTDVNILPANNPVVIAHNVLQNRFAGQESTPIEIIVPNGANKNDQVEEFVSILSDLPGVLRINPVQTFNQDVLITAIQSTHAHAPESGDLVKKIRSLNKPNGTLVGGMSAELLDSQTSIKKTLPIVYIWVGLAVFILIFIFTGSLILPIKAVLLNAFSLSASLGMLSYIFIQGHLKWLVGDFTVTGHLDTGTVILIAVVVFGLSMDYEIFLLSRIKDEYALSKNNEDAVANGLQKSANIITAAALILTTVFAVFLTSGVTPIKLMGFGISFAILLDATVIRAFLVPALMRLLGNLNWWCPKWLKKFTVQH